MQERKPSSPAIHQVIQITARILESNGIESARLEAELIWEHVLKLSRLQLQVERDQTVEPGAVEAAKTITDRRARREPLQHILGEAHFFGLVFKVNPDVLIPRPETELLVERAVDFLREHPGSQVFDFGTGSGCIPISIAREVPECRVWSVDISEAALSVARSNAEQNGVADRIQFLCGDGLEALEASLRFDLIVSNPPYIPTADLIDLQPEVRDHDPTLALDGGTDGLVFYSRLARNAAARLISGGKIMIELGHDQAAAVRALFESEKWIVEHVLDDYSRIPRILIARR